MAQSQQKVVVYVHVYGWYKQVTCNPTSDRANNQQTDKNDRHISKMDNYNFRTFLYRRWTFDAH